MTFGAGICSGEFLAPTVDAITRICNRCAAELEVDDPRLARGLGQHRMMPTVPRGDIPVHLAGREGRVRVPISVVDSVPKHDPLNVVADIRLNLGERLAMLIWGRVVVETHVDGVIRVSRVVQHTSVSVPTISGRLTEPVALQASFGE